MCVVVKVIFWLNCSSSLWMMLVFLGIVSWGRFFLVIEIVLWISSTVCCSDTDCVMVCGVVVNILLVS